MSENKQFSQSGTALQSWLITLSVLFFSLAGTVLALICIYALPDKSVRPLEGGLYFLGAAVVVIALLLFRWKKDRTILPDNQVIIKENLSDKFLKWITALYGFSFVFWGIVIALICIYALPDETHQPKTAIVYFLGGVMVMASFMVVVWKNWTAKKH